MIMLLLSSELFFLQLRQGCLLESLRLAAAASFFRLGVLCVSFIQEHQSTEGIFDCFTDII